MAEKIYEVIDVTPPNIIAPQEKFDRSRGDRTIKDIVALACRHFFEEPITLSSATRPPETMTTIQFLLKDLGRRFKDPDLSNKDHAKLFNMIPYLAERAYGKMPQELITSQTEPKTYAEYTRQELEWGLRDITTELMQRGATFQIILDMIAPTEFKQKQLKA